MSVRPRPSVHRLSTFCLPERTQFPPSEKTFLLLFARKDDFLIKVTDTTEAQPQDVLDEDRRSRPRLSFRLSIIATRLLFLKMKTVFNEDREFKRWPKENGREGKTNLEMR